MIAQITVKFEDGSIEILSSDPAWQVAKSALRFCDICDGEIYDTRIETAEFARTSVYDFNKSQLILQEGEIIK